PTRAAPHRRSDGAPAPVLRRHGPRVPPRGRPAGEDATTPSAGSRRRFKAAQARPHSSRTFVTPPNVTRRTCGTRGGRTAQAGRRGRRRSAYEAPRAAVDGGTWLGGAESKRRRRSRLPAPPSRVTLLVRNLEHALALAKALQREAPQVVEAERLPGGELAHHV